jgi:hypothetical protein
MQMFNAEQLQEKWAPILDYQGLDEIKDSHRRSVTAILLENQEKELRESHEFLYESPTNSAGTGGFGGSKPNKHCRSYRRFRPRSDFSNQTLNA